MEEMRDLIKQKKLDDERYEFQISRSEEEV